MCSVKTQAFAWYWIDEIKHKNKSYDDDPAWLYSVVVGVNDYVGDLEYAKDMP